MYQVNDIGSSAGSGAAALPLDGPVFRAATVRPAFGQKAGDFRARAGEIDLIVDLGQRIGSAEWFRGLLTCAALCYATWSLAPPVGPITGFSPPAYGDAELPEARALTIAPIAYGGDTGKRMASTDAVEPLAESPERPIIDLRATLGRGDGFASVLERAGVGGVEADQVTAMLAGVMAVGDIRPGTVMNLTLGRRPNRTVARPLEKLNFRARFDLRIELARVNGALSLTQIPIAVDETPLRIQGRVGDSLYRSARAAGVPAHEVESYLRALNGQIEVPSGIRSDDRFDIIIEHRRAATGEVEVGRLIYAGLVRASGRDLQMMQWTVDGRTQWFEATGVGRQTAGMARPVPGNVSSNYGPRLHPILGYTRMHRGVDFRAGYGTPIVAVTDGRVSRAGWAGGYGRQVRLEHAGGLATSYSHMSRIAVSPGISVRRGQVIGYVGATGLATGPHLHYEVYRGRAQINPNSVRFTSRALLAGGALASFRTRLRSLLSTPLGAARVQQASSGNGASRAR
ncbi:MAG TPA: peptidoglycan DD-metalloendopeptidase family protein [Allosphingosinicella sp.]